MKPVQQRSTKDSANIVIVTMSFLLITTSIIKSLRHGTWQNSHVLHKLCLSEEFLSRKNVLQIKVVRQDMKVS